MTTQADLSKAEIDLLAAAWRSPQEMRAAGVPRGVSETARTALLHIAEGGATSTSLAKIIGLGSWYRVSDVVKNGAPSCATVVAGLTPQAPETFNLTDAGNAERFVVRHGHHVRYVHGPDRWLLDDGCRWTWDDSREVTRLATDTARAIHGEAADAPTTKRADEIARHALTSQRRNKIEDMLALARAHPPVACVPSDLDRDPDLLAVPNGTIDLRTGKLRKHDSADLITKLAPVPFDEAARAPVWTAFLRRVLPDRRVRSFLQRAVGYSLTGDVTEQALFFAYGRGANGKSTALETIRDLLGEGEYAATAAPGLLLASNVDRHLAEVAALMGTRFVTAVEAAEGRSWDEAKVKALTGGDTISARFMYQNMISFRPTHKLWVAANHKPRVRTGDDPAFWRRVHLIPFDFVIPERQRDPNLRAKLRAELPGILRWAIAGCIAWRKIGLRPPPTVRTAVSDYRAAEDIVGTFISERCILGEKYRESVADLFGAFRLWAEKVGEHHAAQMSKRCFGDALEVRGHVRGKSGDSRFHRGIALGRPMAGTDGTEPPAS